MANSDNSLSAFNPEFWSKSMQEIFFKESVALGLANTELRADLSIGDKLNKPYRSYLAAQSYSSGVDISTFNTLTATNEYLEVLTAKVVPFYVDDLDKIQNKWDTASQFSQDAQRVLNNVLDQAVLAEYSNAAASMVAQDLGGSGTGAIAINTGNIANLFSVAARKLDSRDVPVGNRVAVIGSRLLEQLRLYVAGRETGFGETVSDNGLVAKRFGFDIVVSNNLPFTSLITYGSSTSNPSNTETFSVDGVVFTFVSSIGSTAGNILIETNAVDTMANLCNEINNATADATKRIAISAGDRKKLLKAGIVATNSTTTFTLAGYGDIALAEGSAGVANFAITNHIQYPLFMMRKAIDLVTQKSPSVEFRMAEKRLGRYVYPWMLYGKKTFQDMADAMVYCKADISSWV